MVIVEENRKDIKTDILIKNDNVPESVFDIFWDKDMKTINYEDLILQIREISEISKKKLSKKLEKEFKKKTTYMVDDEDFVKEQNMIYVIVKEIWGPHTFLTDDLPNPDEKFLIESSIDCDIVLEKIMKYDPITDKITLHKNIKPMIFERSLESELINKFEEALAIRYREE